jgi:hypothetical protein
VNPNSSGEVLDEPKGLRRFRAGAVIGLAGGITGLAIPVSINLLAFYNPFGTSTPGPWLIGFTSDSLLVGALLLAVSFIFYRYAFSALRKFDRWFLLASTLCNIGSIGLVLIGISVALSLASGPVLVQCIQGSPLSAFQCVDAVQPFTALAVTAGFWLAWIGGLGIVVGISLGARRYAELRLVGGASSYAILLLVLIDPFIALLFPVGGWQYPLLTIPVLALIAPIYVYAGSHRALINGPAGVPKVGPVPPAVHPGTRRTLHRPGSPNPGRYPTGTARPEGSPRTP